MLSLVIAEASLELVPRELYKHNAITAYCRKMGKRPSEILLDNSWHFGAMKGIPNEIKRGRPDLVHFCLLEACTIPLYQEDEISVYVHTIDDKVITVGERVRFPKSYHRFAGIMEQLFATKKIESDGQTLFQMNNMSFSELIDELDPDQVIGLSSEGKKSSYESVAKTCTDETCLVIGGFPKGEFFDSTKDRIDSLFSVDENPLEAHVVVARTLYEYEKTVFM
ncbi:MAG: ribosome biogenesis protein [Nitrososphaeria archaeon]|nr:ribosome biogenesis protein [Nitrososphaeria archaeon]NDB62873.1 ribosome biogenesis protein [Nitrosopumilaceae archaeon]NDF27241.1 ribosome biogenesis protein [Nitrosopumilaceae archaeon]NDF29999.1 ribosome biogenesis protein [Nitrososphaeria archaeon]NDF34883.1 ribosome biogenesis protein [Nitrosopumilaceae archaeon]